MQNLTPEGEVDGLASDRRAALPGEELHRRHVEYMDIREGGTLRGSITSSYPFLGSRDGRLRTVDDHFQVSIVGGDTARSTNVSRQRFVDGHEPAQRTRDRDLRLAAPAVATRRMK